MRKRILKILISIEKIFIGTFCFAYFSDGWWFVAIDDYDLYFSKRFKDLANKWRNGNKIIFVYLKPNEKKLLEFSESKNLVLNLD